jgi:hypothetical protein
MGATLKLNRNATTFSLMIVLLGYIPITNANISGVMGPNIDPNDRSIQFRSALSLADDSAKVDQWAYRIQYQHAFNDTFRGRIVMQYRDNDDFEYDFFRTELLYNFRKRAAAGRWSSAVRFDLRTRRGSRAEEVAVNWGNQWDFSDGYRMRATLIAGQEVGGNRKSNDLSVQTRASISRKLESGVRIGLQMLNEHGELGNFGSISSQEVYIGPAISGDFGQFTYEFRYLNGVTSAVPSDNFFFRVTTSI